MNSFYLWGGESFNLPNEPSSLFFKAGEKITADKMNYILRQNSDFYYRLWDKYNIKEFSKSGLSRTDNINNTTQQYLNGQLIESQGVIYLQKENEILPLENCFLTTLKAEILTSSKTGFTLKGRRKNTPISILLFGGGGGGCLFSPATADGGPFYAGGGGGHIYYEIINEQIANDIGSFSVTIGKGGRGGSFNYNSVGSNGSNGGATQLTYSLLSNGSQISRQASGGEGAYLVKIETDTYEINKGNVKGGSGGSGGGGAGYFIYAIGQKNTEKTSEYVIQNRGGNGTYGGGGGSGCINFNTSKNTSDRSDVTYSTISYLDASYHPAAGSSGFTFDESARIHICGGGGGSGAVDQIGGYSYDIDGNGYQTGGDLSFSGSSLNSDNPNFFPTIEDFKEKLHIVPPIYNAKVKSEGGICDSESESIGGGGGGGGGYYSIGGAGKGGEWYVGGGGGGGGFGVNATGGNGGASDSTLAGAGGGGGGWGAPGGNASGNIAGGGGGYGIGGAGGGLVDGVLCNAGIAAGGHGQSGQGGDGICIIYYYV